MDKNEAVKKIKFQVSKRNKKYIAPDKKQQMVQGIIDANTEPEFIIKSEMPEEIMGVKVDWDENKATEVVAEDAIKIVKPIDVDLPLIEKECHCGDDCDCGDDCECKED